MRLPPPSRSIPLAAGILAGLMVSTSHPAPLPKGGFATMFSYDAFPDKTDYLLGERIALRLRVANSGPGAIELPDPGHAASDQPTFALIGPAFPHGTLFNNLMAMRQARGDPSFTAPTTRIRIAPGAIWEGTAAITPLVQVAVPGEYRVRSVIDYQGTRTTSKEARFQVRAVTPTFVQLGLGLRPSQAAAGEVVFIQSGGNSAGVYSFEFRETRPDLSEMHTDTPLHRATVSAGATDIGAPWRNAPYFNELLRWIVWREGRSIKALSSVMRQALSVDLPSEPAYLVEPPLKTTGGPVEVLAVSGNREEISLVEFASSEVGENPSARIAWKDRLPAAPTTITAALAPVSRQSERHLAFTVQHQSGFEIFHSRYAGGGRPEPFQSVRIPTGRLLVDAPPALFAGENGHATIGVLAAPEDRSDACIFVEVEFDAAGKPVGTPRLSTFPLPGRPTSGAVLYSQNQGGPLRLDMVVAVEGSRLLHLDRSRHLTPVSFEGTPTHPILLAPGAQAAFMLCVDPKRGLYFGAL